MKIKVWWTDKPVELTPEIVEKAWSICDEQNDLTNDYLVVSIMWELNSDIPELYLDVS